MRHAVVDASAFVSALVEPDGTALRQVLASTRLHAPHLVDIEILSALRRLEAMALAPGDAADTLSAFRQLTVTRHTHGPLIDRAWDLRHNFTAYDAAYVALAEALEVPLITRDPRLARAASGLIEVLAG